MANIDINRLNEIKNDLEEMKNDDALFIDKDGKAEYAIMKIERFDRAEELLNLMDDMNVMKPEVKIVGTNEEFTYEEYQSIKACINEIIDRTFKPKAEKLN